MRRVNTFTVRPCCHRDRLLLLEVLDASAALWNELTYERRQRFFADEDVWQVDADRYRCRYKGTLGSATAQQVIRRNDEAWRSFFSLLGTDEQPSPPGYWDRGERAVQTFIRNDMYTLAWGERSRLELPVGLELKEKYGLGYQERLRLEACGDPQWTGKQGRLELVYDQDADAFRARQPVADAVRRRDHSLATASRDGDGVAALDIGANNLVAVTTSTGHQRLYLGRSSFARFRATTNQIAELQSQLPATAPSSQRIRELYRRRTARRDHLQDALVRDLAEWLVPQTVTTVVVGALGDVLSTHWSATVNEKTHLFWAHGRFRQRLHEVLEEEYGLTVVEVDETDSSSTCPDCGEQPVNRDGDVLQCWSCGFEGHSDVAASENLLSDYFDGSMARPVVSRENTTESGHHTVPRLKWDDHCWRQQGHTETNEAPTNRSTTNRRGNIATGGRVTD